MVLKFIPVVLQSTFHSTKEAVYCCSEECLSHHSIDVLSWKKHTEGECQIHNGEADYGDTFVGNNVRKLLKLLVHVYSHLVLDLFMSIYMRVSTYHYDQEVSADMCSGIEAVVR